jgi:hypothetical protein
MSISFVKGTTLALLSIKLCDERSFAPCQFGLDPIRRLLANLLIEEPNIDHVVKMLGQPHNIRRDQRINVIGIDIGEWLSWR